MADYFITLICSIADIRDSRACRCGDSIVLRELLAYGGMGLVISSKGSRAEIIRKMYLSLFEKCLSLFEKSLSF